MSTGQIIILILISTITIIFVGSILEDVFCSKRKTKAKIKQNIKYKDFIIIQLEDLIKYKDNKINNLKYENKILEKEKLELNNIVNNLLNKNRSVQSQNKNTSIQELR